MAVVSAMRFRVVLLEVRYSECLHDPAQLLLGAIQDADPGAEVTFERLPPSSYRMHAGVQDIILGAHGAPELWERLPARACLEQNFAYDGVYPPIAYQTENLTSYRNGGAPPGWQQQRLRAVVWEYSRVNAELMGTRHVPLGYVPSFVRPPALAAEPDIDVLFYGSTNARRSEVLERMRALGLEAKQVFGVFGEGIDQLVARSKVVLNVHYYDPGLFESARVLPLLHRGACVLSEESLGGEGAEYCLALPYDELPRAAQQLIQGDRYLARRAEDHERLRRSKPMSAFVADALGLV